MKLALGLFGRPKGHFYSFESGMLATILIFITITVNTSRKR